VRLVGVEGLGGVGVCWILCRGVCLDLCLLFFKFLIYIATMPGSDLLPIEMLTLHLRTVVVFVRGDAISVRGWLVGGSGIFSEATPLLELFFCFLLC